MRRTCVNRFDAQCESGSVLTRGPNQGYDGRLYGAYFLPKPTEGRVGLSTPSGNGTHLCHARILMGTDCDITEPALPESTTPPL